MSDPFLVVRDVRKRYGSMEALRGISFDIAPGELFGLLGPNGAGKTTLLSIVSCLIDATAGDVHFGGRRLRRHDLAVRREIGIGTQDLALYGELTARENLAFFGKLYGLRGDELKRRIDEVLEMTALRERADHRTSTFSGGMKRRLNLGIAVIHRPRLLLLDEPTTGVDPQSRIHIFDRVRDLNAAGTTVVYTSHYMEEVQALCPRIGIMDHGNLIACDLLKPLLQMSEGSITLHVVQRGPEVAERLSRLPGIRVIERHENTIHLACKDSTLASPLIFNALREFGVELTSYQVNEPTLEQVFLHLTQKALRD